MSGSPEMERSSQQSIVEQAKVDYVGFFGRQLEISQPPQLLISTLASLQANGIHEIEAIYFPKASLGRADGYLGWDTKIGSDYYDWLEIGQVTKASPDLFGIWAIVDTSRRPDYAPTKALKVKWEANPNASEKRPVYDLKPHDGLEEIIQLARSKEEIEYRDYWGLILSYLPYTSRFGVSIDEQDGVVFPALGEKIGLTESINSGKAVIRRPTLAEFSYLGNLDRFSHLAQYGTSEAVRDVYKGILDPGNKNAHNFPRAIVSGNTRHGGVAQVDYLLADDHGDAVSFRFVIAFAD